MRRSEQAAPNVTLTSMGRGFEVISSLAELTSRRGTGATVQEVARALGRERSQVSRTLSALAASGHAVRDAEGRYRLAWGWYATAREVVDGRLHTVGLSIIDRLADTTGEACFLGVLAGDSTVTIAESLPRGSRMIGSWLGRAYPAFCSDAGQAVLWDASDDEIRAVFAHTDFRSRGPNAPRSVDDFLGRLRESRERGFAIVDEEAEPDLYSVSAPVWDFRAEVVAGVQIVGERASLEPRTVELAAACRAASAELSAALGHGGRD
ncbi:IclR family transcriptional regulator [Microbacterium rhizosphaerae]|uniref:IclR family transcriptional regulator C-terminal domain-containing protein n=1 Tax=Microbacterium rhizosphaerae TaxID=1678237 RepID=A0ABZ0SII0_9MICO|nr:IclR family transcriptional regulator C-terminal domain-containing protein [Microbacterium rhizosphaerae]WPR89144.1 IclR family transcriptional regulator C-terminal domain-containing protein [Microbacterium rhizosphaerae]